MSIEDWKLTRVVIDGISHMRPDAEMPAEHLLHERQWSHADDDSWVFLGPRWHAEREVELAVEGPKKEVLRMVVHAYDERGQYCLGVRDLPGSGVRKFALRAPGYFTLVVFVPAERLSVVREAT